MKLINYNYEFDSGGNLPKNALENAIKTYEKIEGKINSKYGQMPDCPIINTQLKLAILINTLGDLKGKTILDIGCGAKNSWDYRDLGLAKVERFYDPWLCRITHELGAKVFGIDGASSPDEKYNHIQQNLLSFEEIMEKFKDDSLDLACAWSLFDSPSLYDGRDMFKRAVKGLERKVKLEGFFVFEAIGTGLLERVCWENYLVTRKNQTQ